MTELGLRVGELCALKWQDVDWKNKTINHMDVNGYFLEKIPARIGRSKKNDAYFEK